MRGEEGRAPGWNPAGGRKKARTSGIINNRQWCVNFDLYILQRTPNSSTSQEGLGWDAYGFLFRTLWFLLPGPDAGSPLTTGHAASADATVGTTTHTALPHN